MVRGKYKNTLRNRDRCIPPEKPVVLKEYDNCPKCGNGTIIKLFGEQLGCADCGYIPENNEVKT